VTQGAGRGTLGLEDENVVFVTNALEKPADEGTRKCAHLLGGALASRGVSTAKAAARGGWMQTKLFLDRELHRAIRSGDGDTILYLPAQSGTTGTLLRGAVLRASTRSRLVLMPLQPTELTSLRFLPRSLRPELLLSPSPSVCATARRAGTRAAFVPMGVDLERFRPVDPDEKRRLRAGHGIPDNRFVVLHVGHARPGRNLDWLRQAADEAGALAVAVFGRSQGKDPAVVGALEAGGVRVIDRFLPRVEELYQLADCYLFPVLDESSAIGVPLSVLEAMACDVPVVTTRFGGLTEMFQESRGLSFVSSAAEAAEAVRRVRDAGDGSVGTRDLVSGYSWDHVAGIVEDLVRTHVHH
jgi:glycosyltransferase involved in cell wall biosynthesis